MIDPFDPKELSGIRAASERNSKKYPFHKKCRKASRHRSRLIESIAELDDHLTEKYLSGEEISESEMKAALRRASISMKAVPVLCGAALRNQGIQPLLDAIVDYLPSPLDIPPIEGTNPATGEREIRMAKDEESFSALAFKVMMDEGRKLVYIRIYSGVLKVGKEVYNPRLKRVRRSRESFRCTPTSAHGSKRQRQGRSWRSWG